MNYKNEEEVQNWLFDLIKSRGWTVRKEVPSDETRDKLYPEKIDLIIFKSKYPKLDPIGIELKYMRGTARGTIMAEALDQLLFKYASSSFEGLKLKNICIGIYVARSGSNKMHIYNRGLLNYWGIGYLNLNNNHIIIEFGAENVIEKIIYIQYQNLNFSDAYKEQEKRYPVSEEKILNDSKAWHKFIR